MPRGCSQLPPRNCGRQARRGMYRSDSRREKTAASLMPQKLLRWTNGAREKQRAGPQPECQRESARGKRGAERIPIETPRKTVASLMPQRKFCDEQTGRGKSREPDASLIETSGARGERRERNRPTTVFFKPVIVGFSSSSCGGLGFGPLPGCKRLFVYNEGARRIRSFNSPKLPRLGRPWPLGGLGRFWRRQNLSAKTKAHNSKPKRPI